MSTNEHEGVELEPDRVRPFPAFLVAAVTIAVMVGSVLVAWWLLRALEIGMGYSEPRGISEPAPPTISSVRQTLIEDPTAAPPAAGLEARARQREVLESYRWVDREEERVRIPISRAMELRAEGRTP